MGGNPVDRRAQAVATGPADTWRVRGRYHGAVAGDAAGAGQYNPAQNGVGVTVVSHPVLSLAWSRPILRAGPEKQVSGPELVASRWGDRAALPHGRCMYCVGTRAVEGWGALHSASGERLVHSPSLYSTAWACAFCAVGRAYSAGSTLRLPSISVPASWVQAIGVNTSVSIASPALGSRLQRTSRWSRRGETKA